MENKKDFDVIIIGGSYSGLSAAMSLGRSLRKVLIIDGGKPCNRQTPHSHNFITQDGEEPAVIAQKAKSQVMKYETVSFFEGLAATARKVENGFVLGTESGENFSARKLIFATGIKDLMPEISGFSECWGISVIHCPYCHGYEFRGRNTGILANGEKAFHLSSLVKNLTDKVTVLTSGKADFNEEQRLKLKSENIPVIETTVTQIDHDKGHLKGLVLENGEQLKLDALYASIPFVQHSSIPASLGCEISEMGYLKVNEFQKTTVEGIFACGDNCTMMRSVAASVASGNLAGAMVNMELVKEIF